MSIIYDETSVRPSKGSFNFSRIAYTDATAQWAKHMENYYYLRFLNMNSEIVNEKIQAGKEMLIAERKMSFWKKHPNFNSQRAEAEHTEIKRRWRST